MEHDRRCNDWSRQRPAPSLIHTSNKATMCSLPDEGGTYASHRRRTDLS